MDRHAVSVLVSTMVGLGAACTGAIDGAGAADRSGGTGTGTETGTGAGTGTATGASSAACKGVVSAPARIVVHRLTNVEYANTVRDLFGTPATVAAALPPDVRVDSFDNNASGLTLSTTHLQRYMETAGTITGDVFGSPAKLALLAKVAGCTPGPACLDTFIDRVGRRLYRRPLTDDERKDLAALAATTAGDADSQAPFKVVLQALLQSPSFLVRGEVGIPDASRPGWSRLGGFEMATRLSFLFLGTAPDDGLLDAAARGQLDTATGVETATRVLLGQAGAGESVRRFSGQWMRLHEMAAIARDPMRYPLWSVAQRGATIDVLQEETLRLADDFLWRDGASALDLLTAPYTYLHATTAPLYGLPAPARPWQRTMLPTAQARSGLLTLPSVLTITSESDRLAPIRRGKFVREVLTCDPPRPPPQGVPKLPDTSTGQTVREELDQHRKDPSCFGCHEMMDPVGFGLENYDIVGKHRRTDAAGRALTGQGRIVGLDPPEFTGAAELGQRLKEAPQTSACFVKHLFRYAYGRTDQPADACALATLDGLFRASQFNYREALVALVKSDNFRYIGSAP